MQLYKLGSGEKSAFRGRLSSYDPKDICSGDLARTKKSLRHLLANPQNNLTIFFEGKVVLSYAADLTEEYVEFNKGDISDPTSLGG